MRRHYQLKMNIPQMSNSGHAYLDELEKEALPYSYYNPEDRRADCWLKEREVYGFDDTETWGLESTFYSWLYEHLRMYVDHASRIINLDFHEFIYNGIVYTQIEIIEMILERIRYYFSEDYDDFEEDDVAYIKEIGKLWALVLPVMWW